MTGSEWKFWFFQKLLYCIIPSQKNFDAISCSWVWWHIAKVEDQVHKSPCKITVFQFFAYAEGGGTKTKNSKIQLSTPINHPKIFFLCTCVLSAQHTFKHSILDIFQNCHQKWTSYRGFSLPQEYTTKNYVYDLTEIELSALANFLKFYYSTVWTEYALKLLFFYIFLDMLCSDVQQSLVTS